MLGRGGTAAGLVLSCDVRCSHGGSGSSDDVQLVTPYGCPGRLGSNLLGMLPGASP